MSRVYADVIVDISQEKLDKTFQYEVPEALQKQAEIGKQVRISFGDGKRELTGYIVGLSGEAKIAPERIKPILKVEEKGMEIESRLISLAACDCQRIWFHHEPGVKDCPSRKSEGKDKGETVSLSAGKRRNLCRAFRGIQKKAL